MYARMLDKHVGCSKTYQLEIKVQEKDSSENPVYHKKLSYLSMVNKFCIFRDDRNEWEYFQEMKGVLAFIKVQDGVTYEYSVTFHKPDDATSFECEEVGQYEVLGQDIHGKVKTLLDAFRIYTSVEFER